MSGLAVFHNDWLCLTSHRQRGHLETAPHLLYLAKDVELGVNTVPTGNRTPGRRVAVHYTTGTPRQFCLVLHESKTSVRRKKKS